jgi:glycosyltransferase involved in cell wall biosynthesis
MDPTHAQAHLALGQLQDRLSRREHALDHLAHAMHSGVAPPGACDRLGYLLAERGRWDDATAAYNCALDRRKALFGFTGDVPPADQGTAADGELCAMLARLGARYWSERLMVLFDRQAPTDLELPDTWWPIGSAFPYRPKVDVPRRAMHISRSRPLLSVMIPVYNVADSHWLKACLESVLMQDKVFDSAEIIVVDDASASDTARGIVNEFGGRVRYQRNRDNLGLVGNHNYCIEQARGEFLHFLHQDDTVEPGFYDAVLEPMLADERLVAAFTHNRYIDARGNQRGTGDPPRPQLGVLPDWYIRLSLEIRIQFPSIVVRRKTYEKVGGFYPGRRFSFDWDLWNRVAASGPVWYDPRPLANYRVHQESATFGFREKERVVDAMQTVANMVQLVPTEERAAVAEMGMYKFFFRYWRLITGLESSADSDGKRELAEFFLDGWATPQQKHWVLELLDSPS